MVIKPPENKYEREILKIIKTRQDFLETVTKLNKQTGKMETTNIWPEGEKSILYDLCVHNIPKFIYLDWEHVDLDAYVSNVKSTYSKHKTIMYLNLISLCINNLKIGYKTKVENGTLIFLEDGGK